MEDLDRAAQVNLAPPDLHRYYEYKRELVEECETEEDMFCILSGFIWDCTEQYSITENDADQT